MQTLKMKIICETIKETNQQDMTEKVKLKWHNFGLSNNNHLDIQKEIIWDGKRTKLNYKKRPIQLNSTLYFTCKLKSLRQKQIPCKIKNLCCKVWLSHWMGSRFRIPCKFFYFCQMANWHSQLENRKMLIWRKRSLLWKR